MAFECAYQAPRATLRSTGMYPSRTKAVSTCPCERIPAWQLGKLCQERHCVSPCLLQPHVIVHLRLGAAALLFPDTADCCPGQQS